MKQYKLLESELAKFFLDRKDDYIELEDVCDHFCELFDEGIRYRYYIDYLFHKAVFVVDDKKQLVDNIDRILNKYITRNVLGVTMNIKCKDISKIHEIIKEDE